MPRQTLSLLLTLIFSDRRSLRQNEPVPPMRQLLLDTNITRFNQSIILIQYVFQDIVDRFYV